MGNIATVGEERRRCFGIGGKLFALCVVTSPMELDPVCVVSAGKLGGIAAVGAWAECNWYAGCGGSVQSVR